MDKLKRYLILFLMVFTLSTIWISTFSHQIVSAQSTSCNKSGFFALPPWYEYLPSIKPPDCEYKQDFLGTDKNKLLSDLIGPIALAVLDILLHIAGLVAIGLIIFGGIQYTTSQGSPEGTKKAKGTILNALIGLVIALLAIGAIKFIGSNF